MTEERNLQLVCEKLDNSKGENSDVQPQCVSRVMEGTSKKMSPLKHVSPILKKYNSQRHGKNVKTVRSKSNKNIKPLGEIIKLEEVSCSGQPSSPLRLEVLIEPHDVMNDSDFLSDQLSSLGMAQTLTKGCPGEDQTRTVEGLNDKPTKSDPTSKDDFSPPTNQTSKMVKLNLTERKRSRVMKKKNRLQKELEHTLPLVCADDKAACEDKGYKYALSFFLKTKERLESDVETFDEFLRLMNDFSSSNNNVVDLYHRIAALLRQYPDLCEEFLAFLLPEQALQCERFMEHLSLAEMMSFLRKLEIFFIKQPQHLRKIYSCWSVLAENPTLTLEEVRSSIIPLLKGNKLLEDSFMELLPGAAPPESKMGYGGGPDVEMLPYEDMDSELSDEEKRSERVYVPGGKSDSYGGDSCHCCCHDTDDQSYASKSKHCVPCGMKFIAGKVYLQTEHGLRPVRVNFGSSTSYSNNLKRLNADPRKLQRSRGPRRSRTANARPGGVAGTGTGTATLASATKDTSPAKGTGKTVIQEEKDEESSSKQKSPRCRSKSISCRSKDKASVRTPQQGCARTNPRAKGKSKMSISPPAAAYDEIALPAPEPTAAKSDATDFSALSDVLRQEKFGQVKTDGDVCKDPEVFQVGSDDSTGEDILKGHEERQDSAIEEVDGGVLSDCSDVSRGDGDSDEAMSVDSFVESDGDGESEGEGEASSQEGEDCGRRQAWTRDEDRIILQCFQAAGGQDDCKTFEKISQLMPSRTQEEIKDRFHVLMKLIQQLT